MRNYPFSLARLPKVTGTTLWSMTMITTQKELREAFWQGNDTMRQFYRVSYRQNDYSATVRCEWCDFVEMMYRDGHIGDALAQRATL